jgi:hypothetical protein
MKFIVKIDGNEVLMDTEQVEALTHILQDCDHIYDKSVDKGLGTHGYNMSYVHRLKNFNCFESLTLKVMPQDRYETIKLTTKLAKENE